MTNNRRRRRERTQVTPPSHVQSNPDLPLRKAVNNNAKKNKTKTNTTSTRTKTSNSTTTTKSLQPSINNETHVLSIVIPASSSVDYIKWTLHASPKEHLAPLVVWTTPHIQPYHMFGGMSYCKNHDNHKNSVGGVKRGGMIHYLYQHLHPMARRYLFELDNDVDDKEEGKEEEEDDYNDECVIGGGGSMLFDGAKNANSLRRYVHVYVASDFPDQSNLMMELWSCVPGIVAYLTVMSQGEFVETNFLIPQRQRRQQHQENQEQQPFLSKSTTSHGPSSSFFSDDSDDYHNSKGNKNRKRKRYDEQCCLRGCSIDEVGGLYRHHLVRDGPVQYATFRGALELFGRLDANRTVVLDCNEMGISILALAHTTSSSSAVVESGTITSSTRSRFINGKDDDAECCIGPAFWSWLESFASTCPSASSSGKEEDHDGLDQDSSNAFHQSRMGVSLHRLGNVLLDHVDDVIFEIIFGGEGKGADNNVTSCGKGHLSDTKSCEKANADDDYAQAGRGRPGANSSTGVTNTKRCGNVICTGTHGSLMCHALRKKAKIMVTTSSSSSSSSSPTAAANVCTGTSLHPPLATNPICKYDYEEHLAPYGIAAVVMTQELVQEKRSRRLPTSDERGRGQRGVVDAGDDTDSSTIASVPLMPSYLAGTPSPQSKGCVGQRIAKVFEKEIYFGTIVGYEPSGPLWHVEYDDGDSEDYDSTDLKRSNRLYVNARVIDPKIDENDDDEFDLNDDGDAEVEEEEDGDEHSDDEKEHERDDNLDQEEEEHDRKKEKENRDQGCGEDCEDNDLS